MAAEIVTQNSGAEVPNATIVRPMTNSETPNLLAILEDESTSQVAPLHIIARHTTRIIESIRIAIQGFQVYKFVFQFKQ